MQSEPNGGTPPDASQSDVIPDASELNATTAAAPAPNVPASDTVADATTDATPPDAPAVPPVPPVLDIEDLDWSAVRDAVDPAGIRARVRNTVEQLEALLDHEGGPGLLFDADRANANDRAVRVVDLEPNAPLWFIGDLHGDRLPLAAALALIRRDAPAEDGAPRVVFLGDLFDDEGYGLEVLLRVFELIVEAPRSVCVVAGNHDDALHFTWEHFTATVSPSDFTDFLNAHLAHEWITRTGKLAVRLFASAPRALFFPDGLLVTHGGFPLVDLQADLRATATGTTPAASPTSRGRARIRGLARRCRTARRAAASSGTRTSPPSATSARSSADL